MNVTQVASRKFEHEVLHTPLTHYFLRSDMAPKLKPMSSSHTRAHQETKEPEEIVVGNLKVGKDGIVFLQNPSSSGSGGSDGPETPTIANPTVRLDQLEKKRALGEGRQGTVSQYVLKENRSVSYAVKKIPVASATDPKSLQSLGAELRNIFTEDNEYTIKLYNAFYRSHNLYLVMEYMNWGNLEELCSAHPRLAEPVSAYIAGQILHSLALLHRRHVVAGSADGKETRQIHRDIKPANVLLACDGAVKLADFGVAANAETVGASSFVGTTSYMSPERIRGGTHGPQSDIWSVGVVVAQMIVGEYPFSSAKTNFMKLLQEITQFERLDFRGVAVSPECEDFVDHCLALKEDDRWTAEQLLNHPWVLNNEAQGREELRLLLESAGDITLHRANTSITTSEGGEKSPLGVVVPAPNDAPPHQPSGSGTS